MIQADASAAPVLFRDTGLTQSLHKLLETVIISEEGTLKFRDFPKFLLSTKLPHPLPKPSPLKPETRDFQTLSPKPLSPKPLNLNPKP